MAQKEIREILPFRSVVVNQPHVEGCRWRGTSELFLTMNETIRVLVFVPHPDPPEGQKNHSNTQALSPR